MIESHSYNQNKVMLYHFASQKDFYEVKKHGFLSPSSHDENVNGCEKGIICFLKPEDCLSDLQGGDDDILLRVFVHPQRCRVLEFKSLQGEEKAYNGGQGMPLKLYRRGMLENPVVFVEGFIHQNDIEEI